ncbi:polysaccharide deacetylase family protein [Bacillus sp. CGMCC 1.16607]|uniref:polysaccharide deacetylase family protein n=1 Tax=Bacillus sp. CGMCC 1.16607 TaxID=3351842 RepID=UPI003628F99A
MWKNCSFKVLFICFVIVFSMLSIEKIAYGAENINQITTEKTVPVYDQIDGKSVIIGQLLTGQTYQVLDEDEVNYYLPFGNGTGIVKKEAYIKNVLNEGLILPTLWKNSNKVVITKKSTFIFKETAKGSQPIAVINTNIRYPIVKKIGDWYLVNVAGQSGYIHGSNVYEDTGIPVLMYHHMLEEPEDTPFNTNAMVIKVSSFELQMNYLKNNGWRTILLDELEDYLLHKQNLTGKVAVISFDDNYLSQLMYAYPILKKNNQKAVSFVIGGKTRSAELPWDPQILQHMGFQQMRQTTDVFDFQHHTLLMHLRERETQIPYLISKSQDEIEEDLVEGKNYIGKIYDDPTRIRYLAYPFGQYDNETIEAAKVAGIRLAFTTETGNVKLGDHPYKLKRQGIGPNHSYVDFIRKINGFY